MTLFAWLCIAHFVGDWLLQNDWMAREKSRHPLGPACLIHCLIYTTTVGCFYVMANAPLALPGWRPLLFTLIVFTTHWLIDGLRLAERWGALLVQTPSPPVRTVVDQTMHIVVLALAISV